MNIAKRDKIAGAIYGFAIGDAMGATTEFMTEHEIKVKYGKVTDIIGGGWLGLKPGEITDDTQMTMCVMDALMKYPNNILEFEKCCMNNFIEWFKQGPKDIGGQCYLAINRMIKYHAGAQYQPEALGNGSLMRAMPCALLNKTAFNTLQSKLTHNNSVCSGIIQNYSDLIQIILIIKYLLKI